MRMFETGISAAFVDVAVTLSEFGLSSMSLMKMFEIVADESSLIVTSLRRLMTGASLMALTMTSKVSATEPPSASSTRIVIVAVPN